MKTDPLDDRRQARAGEGVPGRHRRRSTSPASACSRRFAWTLADVAAAGRRRHAKTVHAGEDATRSASASGTWSATSTTGPASRRRTTSCPAPSDGAGPDRAPPRASSTASKRCCRNTTRSAAGRRTACRPTRPCPSSHSDASSRSPRPWAGGEVGVPQRAEALQAAPHPSPLPIGNGRWGEGTGLITKLVRRGTPWTT